MTTRVGRVRVIRRREGGREGVRTAIKYQQDGSRFTRFQFDPHSQSLIFVYFYTSVLYHCQNPYPPPASLAFRSHCNVLGFRISCSLARGASLLTEDAGGRSQIFFVLNKSQQTLFRIVISRFVSGPRRRYSIQSNYRRISSAWGVPNVPHRTPSYFVLHCTKRRRQLCTSMSIAYLKLHRTKRNQ
jgi:hypothetical protein